MRSIDRGRCGTNAECRGNVRRVKWLERNFRVSPRTICVFCGHCFAVATIMVREQLLAMPLVAASETGTAQTIRIYMNGVVGRQCHLVEESYQLYG